MIVLVLCSCFKKGWEPHQEINQVTSQRHSVWIPIARNKMIKETFTLPALATENSSVAMNNKGQRICSPICIWERWVQWVLGRCRGMKCMFWILGELHRIGAVLVNAIYTTKYSLSLILHRTFKKKYLLDEHMKHMTRKWSCHIK